MTSKISEILHTQSLHYFQHACKKMESNYEKLKHCQKAHSPHNGVPSDRHGSKIDILIYLLFLKLLNDF